MGTFPCDVRCLYNHNAPNTQNNYRHYRHSAYDDSTELDCKCSYIDGVSVFLYKNSNFKIFLCPIRPHFLSKTLEHTKYFSFIIIQFVGNKSTKSNNIQNRFRNSSIQLCTVYDHTTQVVLYAVKTIHVYDRVATIQETS